MALPSKKVRQVNFERIPNSKELIIDGLMPGFMMVAGELYRTMLHNWVGMFYPYDTKLLHYDVDTDLYYFEVFNRWE
jgi:hypothetical protein